MSLYYRKNDVTYALPTLPSSYPASNVGFNNTNTRLTKNSVQGAITEVNDNINVIPIEEPTQAEIEAFENGTMWISNDKLYVKYLNQNFILEDWGTYTVYALEFGSNGPFTLSVADPGWNGTLEYSTDKQNWNIWNGSELSGNGNQDIYIRGTGNNVISNGNEWTFTGKYCTGNIEYLLDYQTVQNGQHPTMNNNCYTSMFYNCTSLTQAPILSAITLAEGCYDSMFDSCTSLIQAPELPATTLAEGCYNSMFYGCTSLTQAPTLPATTLANDCYKAMFYGCTSLTQAPELPVTILAEGCYRSMFYGCTSLTQAPTLPATTLTKNCYNAMFYGCTSLIQTPELPATTLAGACYMRMFYNCTSLIQISKLSATTLADSCYNGMFRGCTSLKISETQDNITYKYAYRIPTSGTSTIVHLDLSSMFTDTGGTFTGTPEINTTYYTDHEPI